VTKETIRKSCQIMTGDFSSVALVTINSLAPEFYI